MTIFSREKNKCYSDYNANGFLKFLPGFTIANKECIFIYFHIFNNGKSVSFSSKIKFWLHENLRIWLAVPFPLLYCHKFGKHLRKSLNIKTFKKIADIYFPSKDPKIRLM